MSEKTLTKRKFNFKDQRLLLCIVIILIVVIVSIANPKFIEMSNILSIFKQISVMGILTMAMAMLLISGGIDLSIGNIMALSAVVMANMIMSGSSVMLSVVAGIAVGAACGILNGFIIAKSKCVPLIISLGTSQIFYGLSLTISQGRIMNFDSQFDAIGSGKIGDVFPVMLFFLIAMVIIAYVIINYTKFGRRIVAIGGNEKNAYLSGINVDGHKIAVYLISGLFCGVAAIIFAARLDSITATAGSGYELSALTAAIIGGITFERGRGTIPGAFLGCLFMGIIANAMNILGVESYTQTIITGIIIVGAVVLSNISNLKKK
ncbi:MAG: ABC transporter permease [Christensenellaceae bacterium]